MKTICISDLHGHLPEIEPCDLLILGGDICPAHDHSADFQHKWLRGAFYRWCCRAPVQKIIGTWGNHDLIAEYVYNRELEGDFDCSWFIEPLTDPGGKVTFLTDKTLHFMDLKFYGSPWQRKFFDWAFNLTEEQLAEKYKLIPQDTDVLISHGPPFGFGDQVKGRKEHLGSPSLTEAIRERNMKLVVTGHIHTGHGRYGLGDTTIINASLLNECYSVAYKPEVIEL